MAKGVVCSFCGNTYAYEGEFPGSDIIAKMDNHQAICAKNPYRQALRRAARIIEAYRGHAHCKRLKTLGAGADKWMIETALLRSISASVKPISRRVFVSKMRS